MQNKAARKGADGQGNRMGEEKVAYSKDKNIMPVVNSYAIVKKIQKDVSSSSQ